MKLRIYILLIALSFVAVQLKAQAPNALNYQGVARNAAGNTLPNQAIGLKFTIHQGSANGTSVYQETDTDTTNQFGLFTLAIGKGKVVSGNFSTISWGSGSYYLQIEMGPAGGTSYNDMGSTQFLSVPYALYAQTSGSSAGTTVTGVAPIVITGTASAPVVNIQGSNANVGSVLYSTGVGTSAAFIPTGSAGQVLQSNGSAAPTWVTISGSGGNGWGLTGNTGTVYGTNFIGTTNNEGLMFKVNGIVSGRIEDNNSSSGSYNNTSIGYNAQPAVGNTITNNTAFGFEALNANTANNNTAVGSAALFKNTSGSINTAVGFNALYNNVGGSENTVLGYDAAYSNTGNYNLAIGYGALYNNTASSYNVAIGDKALYNFNQTNVLASGLNVAVGYGALFKDQVGSANVAIGDSALALNTTGGNTAVGYQAMESNTDGNSNVAIGYEAMKSNTTSIANTAIGYEAMLDNTTGTNNTGIGENALQLNQAGVFNVGIGDGALSQLTGSSNTGSYNTAVGGNGPEFFNITGNSNISIGYNSGENYSTGNNNVSIGNYAMGFDFSSGPPQSQGGASNNTAIGYEAGYNITASLVGGTGINNTMLGYQAGQTNAAGSSNTIVGAGADVSISYLTNATAIGANAIVAENNAIVLGNNANVGIGTSTPNSSLQISSGNVSLPITVSAVSIDLSSSPDTYTVIITAAGQTVTLPAASNCMGRIYVIVAQFASGTITTSSYKNFSGISTTSLAGGNSIVIQSDGTNWDQILF